MRKILGQLETALSPECWGGETCDLRLGFIDRLLCSDDDRSGASGGATQSQQQQHNMGALQSSGVYMTLEVLRVIYTTLVSP